MAEPGGGDTARLVRGGAITALVLVGALHILWFLYDKNVPFVVSYDDSFYYFEIARNLAAGRGSTFDGISPTNGYHPLWTLMLVPLFATGAGGLEAVRIVLIGQELLLLVALWGIVDAVARASTGWAAGDPRRDEAATAAAGSVTVLLGALILGPMVLRVLVNGLETAVYAIPLAWLLACMHRVGGRPISAGTTASRVAIGGLLAMAVLARTDAAFLVLTLGVALAADARPLGWTGARRWLVAIGPAAAAIALYVVSNLVWFGALGQVSGDVKREPPGTWGTAWLVACVALACAVPWLVPRIAPTTSAFPRAARALREAGWYVAFLALLAGYYGGLQSFPRIWYFAPAVLFGLLLTVLWFLDLMERSLAEATDRPANRAIAPLTALILMPLVAADVVQVWSGNDPAVTTVRWRNVEMARWIDGNLPADAVVGVSDAGVIGYFSERPVINLDGLVNSHAYARALRDGTAGAFLDARGVRYVANHGSLQRGDSPELRELMVGLWGERGRKARLLHALPFEYIGWTNRSGYGSHDMAVFLYDLDPVDPPR